MLTFTDLINSGVAPSPYKKNVIGPDTDRFMVNYNNIWGSVTDTHMSKGDDGKYYITGSLFRRKNKTEELIYGCWWGGYSFSNSSIGYKTLYDYCIANHKVIQHTKVNNDDVLVVFDMSEDQKEYVEKNHMGSDMIYNSGCCCGDIDKQTKNEREIADSLGFHY